LKQVTVMTWINLQQAAQLLVPHICQPFLQLQLQA
jgi:hypothetical protein